MPDDQIARLGDPETRLAHLFDGLELEREQGITIDVSYRHFATPRRRFRLLDAPGHEEYTRNMATAASGADVAILLVDATRGILPQTRRHAAICNLLGVRSLVLAVNKMDLVGYDEGRFRALADEVEAFAARLDLASLRAIPVSGLRGDNVVRPSLAMPWWTGPTLLSCLEDLETGSAAAILPARLPIQLVIGDGDRRRYAGTLQCGRLLVGDEVLASPSGRRTRISAVSGPQEELAAAEAGDAVIVSVADDIDLARGDVLSLVDNPPTVAAELVARLIWFDESPLELGRSYLLQLGTSTVPAIVRSIEHGIDPETLDPVTVEGLSQNDIGVCRIRMVSSIAFDRFADNLALGTLVLIDRESLATSAAGVVVEARPTPRDLHGQALTIDKAARSALKGQTPVILWFTGLSGAGKSTIADRVEAHLTSRGCHTMLLDGDNLRQGLNRDLGFSHPDRVENIRRVAEVAKLMLDAGLIVLCSFISPFRSDRAIARGLVEAGEFLEIFVDAPLAECIRRDPKGLYRRARSGHIADFTGLTSPYEPPLSPELHLQTAVEDPEASASRVLSALRANGII